MMSYSLKKNMIALIEIINWGSKVFSYF